MALLYRTGYCGEGIVGVRSDQADRSYYQDQDDSQHYRVFGDILSFIFPPKPVNELMHVIPPILTLNPLQEGPTKRPHP